MCFMRFVTAARVLAKAFGNALFADVQIYAIGLPKVDYKGVQVAVSVEVGERKKSPRNNIRGPAESYFSD